MPEESPTTVWASIGGTFKTGDYENIKIDLGLAGVPVGITDEDLAVRLQAAELTLEKVISALASELGKRVKEDLGRTINV